MNIEPLLIFSECYESAVLFISTGKKKRHVSSLFRIDIQWKNL